MILFDEYLPDLPDLGQGSKNIKNAIPNGNHYRSFPSLTEFSSALTLRCRGAIAVKDRDGNVYNYAADANKIYKLADTSFTAVVTTVTGTDISFSASSWIVSTSSDLSVFSASQTVRVSGSALNDGDYTTSAAPTSTVIKVEEATISTETASASVTIQRIYGTADTENWEFIKWKDQVIGCNWDDPVQFISLGGSAFADLPGAPPRARHIGVVGDFVVLGNIHDGSNAIPNQLNWCAIADETSWTANASTQADSQALKGGGGRIQHVSSGDTGYIFQEYSIWTMNYVGSPLVFQFDEVEPGRGTPAPKSVARLGRFAFYLGINGFYVFDGATSTPIGVNKVDKTFYNDLDHSYYNRISSAIDPINHIVMWAYPGAGSTDGEPDTVIIYNWVDRKWSYAELTTQLIYSSFAQGYTLDGLDALSTSLDALPFSLDSRAYKGGSLLLSAFNTDNKLSNLNGNALTATLETMETQHFERQRSKVTSVRPIINSNGSSTASLTLSIGYRDNQISPITYSQDYTPNSVNQTIDVRENGRYLRYKVDIGNGFQFAQGIEVDAKPAGKR